MFLANHANRFMEHHGWWAFGRVIPFLLLLALIGLAVWTVLRLTSRGPGLVPSTGAAVAPARPDGALEEVRLRYARGEMSREEFLQRFQDLGGISESPGEPGQPGAG